MISEQACATTLEDKDTFFIGPETKIPDWQ